MAFPPPPASHSVEREYFIDNLLVRIHFVVEMIWWTGLAPWEFEFPFPGSLIVDLCYSVWAGGEHVASARGAGRRTPPLNTQPYHSQYSTLSPIADPKP